jgi:heme/copper-type cytochrome/quinol oxidase subunit 3
VNASKYTLTDVKYLGLLEIVLGLVNTQFTTYGLYFWAVGFGILHITYGIIMWMKYERNEPLREK